MAKKYRDEDWLREQYVEKSRTLKDIAKELGVDHTTISKWRRKLDIEKPTKTQTLTCPVCGDEFERTKSKIDRAKYANVCSRDCLYEGRSKGIIEREVEGGYDVSPTIYNRECPVCGGDFSTTASEDYKHCSRECFLKGHSENMSGAGNPAYKNGESKDKRSYRGPHWSQKRKKVYERDGYTCQRCGVKCTGRKNYNGENGERLIQAHHIKPYDEGGSNQLENLVTLCASCHGKVEGGEPLNVH